MSNFIGIRLAVLDVIIECTGERSDLQLALRTDEHASKTASCVLFVHTTKQTSLLSTTSICNSFQ